MGSKGLKALVVDDAGAPPVKFVDEAAFRVAAKKLSKALLEHPVTSKALTTYGTAVLVNILNEAGALPTHNFSQGRFEGADKTGGETLEANCRERGGKTGHGCSPGCIIRCSQIYKGKDGETITVEPFRADAFPPLRDLAVNRAAYDRIIEAGGSARDNILVITDPAKGIVQHHPGSDGSGEIAAATADRLDYHPPCPGRIRTGFQLHPAGRR